MTSRRARDTISGPYGGILRTVSSIAPFSTPPGVILKVKRSYLRSNG